MSVIAKEFIDFASNIIHAHTTEIAARNVINRAYYGAYHACKIWHSCLSILGNVKAGNFGEHEVLIQRLSNPFEKTTHPNCSSASKISRQKGYALRSLKHERSRADYDLDCAVDKDHAARAIEQAKLILAM